MKIGAGTTMSEQPHVERKTKQLQSSTNSDHSLCQSHAYARKT
jgi:hypothetical protein